MSLSVCETPSVDNDSEQTRYVLALLYYETAHEEMSRQLQRMPLRRLQTCRL